MKGRSIPPPRGAAMKDASSAPDSASSGLDLIHLEESMSWEAEPGEHLVPLTPAARVARDGATAEAGTERMHPILQDQGGAPRRSSVRRAPAENVTVGHPYPTSARGPCSPEHHVAAGAVPPRPTVASFSALKPLDEGS
jgi:hypothetical protein